MKKLPENFLLEKYGLKVRLINENDADFILSLRANPNRTKHMITLDYDLESQKKWIKEYKKREKEGLDYYFIYANAKGTPIGVNRASSIDFNAKTSKSSSWITIEGLKSEPLKMLVIGNEIIFNLIGVESSWGEVQKNNDRAIKIFKLFGYKLNVDTDTEFCDFSLSRDDFFKACESTILNRIISHNR